MFRTSLFRVPPTHGVYSRVSLFLVPFNFLKLSHPQSLIFSPQLSTQSLEVRVGPLKGWVSDPWASLGPLCSAQGPDLGKPDPRNLGCSDSTCCFGDPLRNQGKVLHLCFPEPHALAGQVGACMPVQDRGSKRTLRASAPPQELGDQS